MCTSSVRYWRADVEVKTCAPPHSDIAEADAEVKTCAPPHSDIGEADAEVKTCAPPESKRHIPAKTSLKSKNGTDYK